MTLWLCDPFLSFHFTSNSFIFLLTISHFYIYHHCLSFYLSFFPSIYLSLVIHLVILSYIYNFLYNFCDFVTLWLPHFSDLYHRFWPPDLVWPCCGSALNITTLRFCNLHITWTLDMLVYSLSVPQSVNRCGCLIQGTDVSSMLGYGLKSFSIPSHSTGTD